MALRKDKVAAALQAMKGICSDPENPTALPEALGQLANILGDVFDDIALPEFPQIDSGEFGFPNDEPFDFPLGGGGIRGLDPLDGLESRGPGGGGPFGGGGGEGGGGDGPGGGQSDEQCLSIFTAKTQGEIPAASGDTPGEGFVKPMSLSPLATSEDEFDDAAFLGADTPSPTRTTQSDYENCRKKCEKENFGVPIEEIIGADDADFLGITQEQAAIELMTECLKKCNEDMAFQTDDENAAPMSVYNISCEKIEKDTTVIVSYDICQDVGYVLVEACGCD